MILVIVVIVMIGVVCVSRRDGGVYNWQLEEEEWKYD